MKQTQSFAVLASLLLGLGQPVFASSSSSVSPLLARSHGSVTASPLLKRKNLMTLSRRQSSGCSAFEEECGTSCMPAGEECCVSVGFEAYCPAGSTCLSDGSCATDDGSGGGGSGPGPSECGLSELACGTGCMPAGEECCESLGIDGYCPAGATCSSDGSCLDGSSGGGGGGGGSDPSECSTGEEACGTGCMPAGEACCESLGFDGYCPAGATCATDGTCADGSSGGGDEDSDPGAGECSPGEETCATGCMPTGSVCCAEDEVYCPFGSTCGPAGTCLGASGGGSGGGKGTGNGGSGSGGGGSGSGGGGSGSPRKPNGSGKLSPGNAGSVAGLTVLVLAAIWV